MTSQRNNISANQTTTLTSFIHISHYSTPWAICPLPVHRNNYSSQCFPMINRLSCRKLTCRYISIQFLGTNTSSCQPHLQYNSRPWAIIFCMYAKRLQSSITKRMMMMMTIDSTDIFYKIFTQSKPPLACVNLLYLKILNVKLTSRQLWQLLYCQRAIYSL